MSYEIVVDVASNQTTERRTFAKRSITLGRSPDNDIVARGDANVSRRHGMLEIRGETLALHDLGSSNGWHVLNEEHILPHHHKDGYPVKIGDRYRLGGVAITIVSFRSGGTIEA